MDLIDNFLNRITMYRLVLYVLAALALIAAIFGAFHILPYDPLSLLFSIAVLTLISWLTNKIFGDIFKTQTNIESTYITALILALIITPVAPHDLMGVSFLIWAAIWATASKYILAINKKHLFNPAAFAVALTAFTINQSATWWIGGNLPMLAFVILGGLLIVRKIRRGDLMVAFFTAAIVSILAGMPVGNPLVTLEQVVLHVPLFFFAFVMLTEPLTTPPTRTRRIIYGAFVGFLFAPWVHIGPIYGTPELALLAGNIVSYFLSPKAKYLLKLKERKEAADGIYDFVFRTESPTLFKPGQYLEWTLGPSRKDLQPALRGILSERETRRGDSSPSYGSEVATTHFDKITATQRDSHNFNNPSVAPSRNPFQGFLRRRALVLLKLWESRTEVFPIWAPDHKHPDSRGNRRYFTIASSPTEQHFRLGVKFYDRSSSFKKRMLSMVPGDLIMAGQLAGDFTMPRDPKKKLAFIAGGIGITPFRSMVKYLSDRDERRDVVLLYSNRAVSEIAYPDVFDEAAQTIGLKTIYAVTGTDETPPEKNGYKGHIDGALIRREIPDYRDRIFYISGTHAMVSVMETMLSEMGIPRRQIKIDFFPGFA